MNVEHETYDDIQAAQADAVPAADAPANPLTKFDAPILKAIESTSMVAAGTIAFLPQTMAEAMEFAKLMAASNFVPPHLRQAAGDCLAIVLQSTRWGMDPFAVGNKSYFVNNRMAFEAQLVNAVVNSSKVLDGRLQVSWQGQGPTLACTVRGKIRGDRDVHELIQEISTITTRNSPLWKQAPKVQLAYHTTRSWARLFTPEVLLGVYTPDEVTNDRGSQTVIPPRPSRRAAADNIRKEQVQNTQQYRDTMAQEPAHDADTGEVHDDTPTAEEEVGQTRQSTVEEPAAKTMDELAEESTQGGDEEEPAMTAEHATVDALIRRKVGSYKTMHMIDALKEDYKDELALMKQQDRPRWDALKAFVDARIAEVKKK